MALSAGTRIGPYEVVSLLGEGGMGQVYQARDTKLGRIVALKILPPAFASNPDRLARFKREAQVLAALNHPNIAAIYGFEDQSATHALVMELVPGQTLAAHIGAPMPAADVLPIARQVAAALEAAHEQNIVHRDLKPANIKITGDGTVKVLDFGLAKAMGTGGTEGDGGHGGSSSADSPTVTSPAVTEMGMILGTARYMAPEQARGKPVDRRADLWALGVILFEMLSGKALYRGETVTDTIAHVITQPPDWTLLPESTPPGVRRLLRRCLEKDPKNRLQSAGDARIEVDELISGASGDTGAGRPASPGTRRSPALRWLPWALVAALIPALVYMSWPKAAVPQPLVKLDVRVASTDELQVDSDGDGPIAVLSPDGQTLVYVGTTATVTRLYLRRLDGLESRPIPGTEGGSQPFFSPDGQSIGFLAGGNLMRTAISGGTPTKIGSASAMRGATWGPDNTIVYTADMSSGLLRISASGGEPSVLTRPKPQERTHRWASFLPDGKSVLFVCQMNNATYEDGTIEAVRLDTGERKVLLTGGSFPRYAASGHLLFIKQGAVRAVRFDPNRLEVSGEARPVIEDVLNTATAKGASSGNGAAQFAIADNGTAVYLPMNEQAQSLLRLAIVDRTGKITYEYKEHMAFRDPRFSRDGKRVFVRVGQDQAEHLRVLDLERDMLTQIVFEGQYSGMATFTRTGEEMMAYASDRGGKALNIFMSRSDGTGESKPLLPETAFPRLPISFSDDGRLLSFMEINPSTNMDVLVLSLADGKVTPFLNSPSVEAGGVFSPDGKWMLNMTFDGTGRPEVFVRSYPDGGARRQVSNGGVFAGWTREGREIVYVNADATAIMAVDVRPEGAALALGKPHQLFPLAIATPGSATFFDAYRDGSKFAVLLKPTESAAPPPRTHVTMVFNLFDEIRRAVGK